MMGAFQNGFGMGMHAFNSAMDRDRQEKRDALQAQYLGLQMDEMKDKAADREAQKKIEAIKSGTAAQNTEPQQGSVVDAAGGGRVFYKDANAAQAAAEDEAFIRDAQSSLDKQKLESQAPPEAYQPSTPASPAPVTPRAGFGVTPLQNKAQVFDTQEGASKYAGLNPDSEYLRVKEMRDRVRASGLKGSDDEAEKLATRMAILKREGAFDAYQAALANNPEATNIWNNSGMHRLEEGTKFVPVDVKNEFGVVERRVQVVNKDGRVVIPDMATAIKAAVLAPDKYFSSIDKSDSYNSRLMTQLMLGSLRGVGGAGGGSHSSNASAKPAASPEQDFVARANKLIHDYTANDPTGAMTPQVKAATGDTLAEILRHNPGLVNTPAGENSAVKAALSYAIDPKTAVHLINPETGRLDLAVPVLNGFARITSNAGSYLNEPNLSPDQLKQVTSDYLQRMPAQSRDLFVRSAFDPKARRTLLDQTLAPIKQKPEYASMTPEQKTAIEKQADELLGERLSWVSNYRKDLAPKPDPSSAATAPTPPTKPTPSTKPADPLEFAGKKVDAARAAEASANARLMQFGQRQRQADPSGFAAAKKAVDVARQRVEEAQSEYKNLVPEQADQAAFGIYPNPVRGR